MAPLNRPSKASREAVAAIVAARKDSTQKVVPSPADPLRYELAAVLEAYRDGRVFDRLPVDHPVEVLRPTAEPVDESSIDPSSPAAGFIRAMEDLRKRMAADKDPVDLDAIRREAIKEIEADNRQRERRERQRAKKQRRRDRKAVQARGGDVIEQ